MKKLLVIITCILLFFLCCGCDEEPVSDSEGNMRMITSEELGLKEIEGQTGVYVMNSDGTFSPVINRFEGYQGQTSESDRSRYLWLTQTDDEITKLIPHMKKGSRLVMVYNYDDEIPVTYTIEKYNFLGYSVGCHIYRDIDDSLKLVTDDALPGTMAQAALKEIDDEYEYQINEINGSAKLPVTNVDNNIELLLGLDFGKYYDFEFYKGTKYLSMSIIADSLIFQSEKVISLDNPYTKTKEGYFIINLPDNLSEGYYYVLGMGMLYYEA